MIENLDLAIKITTLFLLGGTSELAFKKRRWAIMILSFAVWATLFRTTILRAISIYAGVFNHISAKTIQEVQGFFMNGYGVLVTDFLLLIGVIAGFIIISTDVNKNQHKKKIIC